MANRDAEAEDRQVTPRYLVCIGCDRIPYCRRLDTVHYQDYNIVDGEVVWEIVTTRVNMIILGYIKMRGYCPDHAPL